jgi:hypothetical protein
LQDETMQAQHNVSLQFHNYMNWKKKKTLHTPLVIQPYFFKDILLVFFASISL